MKRRSFLQVLGLGSAAVVVGADAIPVVASKPNVIPNRTEIDDLSLEDFAKEFVGTTTIVSPDQAGFKITTSKETS